MNNFDKLLNFICFLIGCCLLAKYFNSQLLGLSLFLIGFGFLNNYKEN
jgi:hypothetical protein